MDFADIISEINFLAVLVSAIVSMALGWLWYSPLLFANTWMKENGFTVESMKGRSPLIPMISSFILYIIMAFILAVLINASMRMVEGYIIGAGLGVGFVAISLGITYLFEAKSLKLFLINAGYLVLNLTIMGGIIGAWK